MPTNCDGIAMPNGNAPTPELFARDADGKLTHRGSHWYFHYDEPDEGDDEPVYRLGDHTLALGSYLTIHESDGRDMTYRVTQHLPALRPSAATPVHAAPEASS